MSIRLDTPVQYLKGVGPRRAQIFSGAGIQSTGDLLRNRPARYQDRTNFKLIRDLNLDEEAVIRCRVIVAGRYTTPIKRVQIFEMVVSDRSGSMPVKFFNQPYLERVFRKEQEVILFGTVRNDPYVNSIGLVNPDYELIESDAEPMVHTGRIVPIYRKLGQLTTKQIRQLVSQALHDLDPNIEDTLPEEIKQKYGFPHLRVALEQLHFPAASPGQEPELLKRLETWRTPAQRRFIFEDFYSFQLGLQVLKKQREIFPKKRHIRIYPSVRETIKSVLPFHPTAAQKRVVKEIADDLCSSKVMNRLLQGDVGSGKTIVALQAILVVIENGFQAALMAPTEILASQHYERISAYLAKTRYRIGLLTSSVKGAARKHLLTAVQEGKINLLIGTHALIQKKVTFKDLALVVVDEQHRFGVLQRSLLSQKGDRPDTLVMTATPIPRSLALTLYGDLDLSVIDEMPPGRQPVHTILKTSRNRKEVYALVAEELEKGRQAFVVYPLIEESEKIDLKAATEMAEHLRTEVFKNYTVELLHGRLKADVKEELMQRFKSGETQILVSTTVIEVGIDIPNASVMLIEHAERFGLSQLHQLRGRIGRGAYLSYCILIADRFGSREAFERLDIMRKTSDGFKISEKDLELRGPGEFLGTRQSGMPEFIFGSIVRDRDLLAAAHSEAETRLEQVLEVSGNQQSRALKEIQQQWQKRFSLYGVG
ncbi:MAG: ATP-dependent DNA helicase RecG [Acidobacteria bacterium]|nr:ATP-dependent DNA helicase RecG [Acidobacteriota bacterium]